MSFNEAESARVREQVLALFAAVLHTFDPRRSIGHEGLAGTVGFLRHLPEVVADLAFTPVRGGRAAVPPGCWEEDRPPVIGELVLVADGGAGPYEATVTSTEQDGSLVLVVHAFVAGHA
jgi:hypothetical protein